MNPEMLRKSHPLVNKCKYNNNNNNNNTIRLFEVRFR